MTLKERLIEIGKRPFTWGNSIDLYRFADELIAKAPVDVKEIKVELNLYNTTPVYEPMSHDGKPVSMRSIRKRRRKESVAQMQSEIDTLSPEMPFFTLRNPLR